MQQFWRVLIGSVICWSPAFAEPVRYTFVWPGEGGYLMRGALAFDTGAARDGIIAADAVDCFVIEGFRGRQRVGRWALSMLTEQTTWTLAFDVEAEAFVVFGGGDPMPQAWNMDGGGFNCGMGGFGFNIGNAAQDLCADGQLLFDSQVDPARPFPATEAPDYQFPADACHGPTLISRL